MNHEERAELLRARYRAKHPSAGAAVKRKAERGPKRAKWWVTYGKAGIGAGNCAVSLGAIGGSGVRVEWLKQADAKQAKPLGAKKRREETSTLTTISGKLKRVKLPRLALREPWQVAP